MVRALVGVRTAGPDDRAALTHLASLARQEGLSATAASAGDAVRLEMALSRPDVQVLLAEPAEPGGLPIGVLVLRQGELLPLSGSEAAHVEQLWVHPEHRRRGVARALLRTATAHAQQLGLDEVTCTVPPADREAQRFLARLGFTPLVTRRVVSVSALRRRLGVDVGRGRRPGLDQLLARRRREHRQPVGGPSTS